MPVLVVGWRASLAPSDYSAADQAIKVLLLAWSANSGGVTLNLCTPKRIAIMSFVTVH